MQRQPANFGADLGWSASTYWSHVVADCVAAAENVDSEARAIFPHRQAAIVTELLQRFEDGHAYELMPGALEALRHVRHAHPDVKLAVLSNNDRRLHAVLERLGIARFFDDNVVASATTGLQKPDARIFHHLLRSVANLAPSDAGQLLHVGDDLENDVRGSVRAGALAVHLDASHEASAATPLAQHVAQLRQHRFTTIATLHDLPQIVSQLAAKR